jgi:hypothetical protein
MMKEFRTNLPRDAADVALGVLLTGDSIILLELLGPAERLLP